jgi:hypothetical protein
VRLRDCEAAPSAASQRAASVLLHYSAVGRECCRPHRCRRGCCQCCHGRCHPLPFTARCVGESAKPAVFLAYLPCLPWSAPMVQAQAVPCAPEALCSSSSSHLLLSPSFTRPSLSASSSDIKQHPYAHCPPALHCLFAFLALALSLRLCSSPLITPSTRLPWPPRRLPHSALRRCCCPPPACALFLILAFHCMPTTPLVCRPPPLYSAPGCP